MKKNINNLSMCELDDDDVALATGGAVSPKLNSYILNLLRNDSKYDSPELKTSSPAEMERKIKEDSEKLIKEVFNYGN